MKQNYLFGGRFLNTSIMEYKKVSRNDMLLLEFLNFYFKSQLSHKYGTFTQIWNFHTNMELSHKYGTFDKLRNSINYNLREPRHCVSPLQNRHEIYYKKKN